MPRTACPAPVCVATRPDSIPLERCRHCAGRGFQPTEDATLAPCVACEGHGWQCMAGDLGATRTYKTRPFLFNPGSGLLTVERNKKVERYTLKEFAPQMDFPARAFECVRETGVRSGEVYHLLASRGGITCDCAGRSYEATARANTRAYYEGGDQFASAGCVHADAVALLLRAGLFGTAADVPADQPEPTPAPEPEPVEQCGYCLGRGRTPGPTHLDGRPQESREEWCYYCGGEGALVRGGSLLPHRGL